MCILWNYINFTVETVICYKNVLRWLLRASVGNQIIGPDSSLKWTLLEISQVVYLHFPKCSMFKPREISHLIEGNSACFSWPHVTITLSTLHWNEGTKSMGICNPVVKTINKVRQKIDLWKANATHAQHTPTPSIIMHRPLPLPDTLTHSWPAWPSPLTYMQVGCCWCFTVITVMPVSGMKGWTYNNILTLNKDSQSKGYAFFFSNL